MSGSNSFFGTDKPISPHDLEWVDGGLIVRESDDEGKGWFVRIERFWWVKRDQNLLSVAETSNEVVEGSVRMDGVEADGKVDGIGSVEIAPPSPLRAPSPPAVSIEPPPLDSTAASFVDLAATQAETDHHPANLFVDRRPSLAGTEETEEGEIKEDEPMMAGRDEDDGARAGEVPDKALDKMQE